MPTWFYYDDSGQKNGPITVGQLQDLAKQGVITPETTVETDTGVSASAGKVNGLTFLGAITSSAEPNLCTIAPSQTAAPSVAPAQEVNQVAPKTVPVPVPIAKKQKSILRPAIVVGITAVIIVGICCLALPWSSSKDKELAKKDLHEISNLGNHSVNITKYINEKGGENFRTWKRLAGRRNPEGQVLLGLCYYYGAGGVSQDLAMSENWFRKAAKQGYTEGQYRLAMCYYKGEGVQEDKVEAVKWLHKAAELGHVEAQYQLGTHYRTESEKWLRKATEQGRSRR